MPSWICSPTIGNTACAADADLLRCAASKKTRSTPTMLRSQILGAVLAIGALAIGVNAQEQPSGNLARTARTTVSSESEGTKAENLTDGDITNSEWTAKEGTTPANTWVQLDWPGAVQIQEILIRQDGDPKLTHVNLQARDPGGEWRGLKSIGDSLHLIPRL